ncbi:MAG TPA: glycosyltransferase [Vicinamibacterales bacterium]|nr:glycosyltransferase [Vicinamibacterales bacterium]
MKRPLVLHVIPAVAPRYGGPSAAVIGMCRALQSLGAQTLIATTDADGPTRLDVSLERATLHQGVPCIFFPKQASESFKWSPRLAAWLSRRVGDFDLVHVHAVFSHAVLAAGRASRRHDVPYLVRPLGTLDPWSVGRHAYRKRMLLALGLHRVLCHASAMHYTTTEERQLAESQLPNLPHGDVVPLGIDDGWFQLEDGPRQNTFVCLSRIESKKGVDLAIDAFHRIAADPQLAGWRLIIAGQGEPEYVRQLEARAADGDGRGRIEFTGWLEGESRANLLQRGGVFVLPSQQENFGIALAEAMAAGMPAIVTPGVNLAAEIRHHDAGWVVERSVDAVAAAMRGAAADAARLDRGRRARQLASRFQWPAVAAGLDAMYRRVIDRHASRSTVAAAAPSPRAAIARSRRG